MLNFPFRSVTVPKVVPSIIIVAAGKGSPIIASVTKPVTVSS